MAEKSPQEELSLSQIQQVELETLVAFDKFCRANSLRYWLAYGSLLGSVRHGGFIPWDDDTDVVMPVQDYRRLLKICRQDPQISENCRFVSPSTSRYAKSPWGKIVDLRTSAKQNIVMDKESNPDDGLWVDIFPIWSEYNCRHRNKLISTLGALSFTWHRYAAWERRSAGSKMGRILQKIMMPVCKSLGPVRMGKFAEFLAVHTSGKFYPEGRFRAYWFDESFDADVYRRTATLEFCGQSFPVPAGYEKLLAETYGDWRCVPEEEKRVIHPMSVKWRKLDHY